MTKEPDIVRELREKEKLGELNCKLNLGCGKDIRKGWENYDLYPLDKIVKKIDLNKLPLPFENNYADYILLSHTFEHLDVNRLWFDCSIRKRG